MSNKLFNLIVAITGAVSAGAVAIVTYISPAYATQINAAIPIVATCIVEVCNVFKKDAVTK